MKAEGGMFCNQWHPQRGCVAQSELGVLGDLHIEAGFDINYPKQLSWHCPLHAWYEDSVCSPGGQMDITSICREQHYVKQGGWSRRPFVFIWRQCSWIPRTKTGCDWKQGRVFPHPRTMPTSTLTVLKEIKISLWVWRGINPVVSALRWDAAWWMNQTLASRLPVA